MILINLYINELKFNKKSQIKSHFLDIKCCIGFLTNANPRNIRIDMLYWMEITFQLIFLKIFNISI
jgi:hypothetical protein